MTQRRGFMASLLALFLLCAVFAHAEERFPLVFDVLPFFWGSDLGVGYRGFSLIPGTDTILWAYGGGGYQTQTYIRMPDGTLITGAAPGTVTVPADINYDRWSWRWQAGIEQGFLWNSRTQQNLLEAVLFYRGRYDSNVQASPSQLIYQSASFDRFGLVGNAVIAGVIYDDLLFNPVNRTRNGIHAELTGEWGYPIFTGTVEGSFTYLRFNLTAKGFLPLFDAAPTAEMNVFSVCLCDFASVDYALGSSVPLHIRQTFGGMKPRTGLGGALRGIDSGSLDANLKAVNNLEVRAYLPALFIRDIVPGILVFCDAGAYAQLGEGVASPAYGFVAATGAGAFVDIFDFAQIVVYGCYRLTGVNADAQSLSLEYDFILKF